MRCRTVFWCWSLERFANLWWLVKEYWWTWRTSSKLYRSAGSAHPKTLNLLRQIYKKGKKKQIKKRQRMGLKWQGEVPCLSALEPYMCLTSILGSIRHELHKWSCLLAAATPWFEAYRECFLQTLPPSDHEFLKHCLACILSLSWSSGQHVSVNHSFKLLGKHRPQP